MCCRSRIGGASQVGAAAARGISNGNLKSDGSTNYVYDGENRLVSASGAHNATLTYDPLGRLFEVSGPAGTTRFLYNGDALIEEYDRWGTMLRRYGHGPGADEGRFAGGNRAAPAVGQRGWRSRADCDPFALA